MGDEMSFVLRMILSTIEYFTGHKPKLEWFMSNETRKVIFDAIIVFGERYYEFGEIDISKISPRNTNKELFEESVETLIDTIFRQSATDEWRNDMFFYPAIFTRIENYLKMDGVSKSDSKYILSRFQVRRNLKAI